MFKRAKSCPGQDTAYLKDFNTNIVPCTKCGYEIEFFSDEKKVRCPKCHSNVFKVDSDVIAYENKRFILKDDKSNCLDWCGQCLNSKDYKDLKENYKRIEIKKKDMAALIDSIDENDVEAINFFIDAFKKSINYPKLIDSRIFDILKKTNLELFIKVRNYYLNFNNENL